MSTFNAAVYGALSTIALVLTSQPSVAQAVLSIDGSSPFVRGGASTVAVKLAVKSKAVSFHRLYVKFRCRELIDFTHAVPEEKDDKGKKTTAAKSINVKREETLFERQVPLEIAKEYEPGSTHTVKAQIELPSNLPPTARGKFSQIKWEAEVVGDVVGKFWDANTGWQEITVK